MNEVDAAWPLLRYLADDRVYFARYREHMRAFATTVFTEANLGPLMARYHELVAPHAVGSAGEQPGYGYLPNAAAFANALPALQAASHAPRCACGPIGTRAYGTSRSRYAFFG